MSRLCHNAVILKMPPNLSKSAMQAHAPVWILGAGTSGAAAARLFAAHGIPFRIFDDHADKAENLAGKIREEYPCEVPKDTTPAFAVVSPGLPPEAPLRIAMEEQKIPIVSELDAALPYLSCDFIGVTGSKGKSSLVKLIADAFTLGGRRAVPCGNYGTALATVALQTPPVDLAVVECSSFQLETTCHLRPSIGIFLNLSPDHLARHGGMHGYRDAKLRLFQTQTETDTALLPSSDTGRSIQARYRELGLRGRIATFGIEPDADWRWTLGTVQGPQGLCLDIAGSYFNNEILGPAAAAGAAAMVLSGLSTDVAAQALRSFVPLPHRMQCVRTLRGVRYINDSKATSLTALLAGVSMVGGPVRLIAGGRLKENDLEIGKELVTRGVQKGYLIGECAEKLSAAWSDALPVELCGTMEIAVAKASAESREGETILLSPGTASFDQFTSFEARGDHFAELVKSLR